MYYNLLRINTRHFSSAEEESVSYSGKDQTLKDSTCKVSFWTFKCLFY